MSIITTTSQPATSSPLKSLITRHPLIAFFVLACAGAWIAVLPLLFARNGSGLPTEMFLILGAYAGPMLAAIIVTAAINGKAGLWQLLRRCVQWRVGIRWYLVALLGYPVLYVFVSCLLLGTAPLNMLVHQWSQFFTLYLPLALTINFVEAVAEETGWRGFAFPRLQQKYGALLGSVILGILLILWHLPGFFGGWLGPLTIPSFVDFLLAGMATTIIWTWIFNNAKGSVLITILLHASSNAVYPFILVLIPVASASNPMFLGEAGLLLHATYIVCALLIIVFTKGRLSYKPDTAPHVAETP
jgi:uncharacterized protein